MNNTLFQKLESQKDKVGIVLYILGVFVFPFLCFIYIMAGFAYFFRTVEQINTDAGYRVSLEYIIHMPFIYVVVGAFFIMLSISLTLFLLRKRASKRELAKLSQ